MQNRLSPEKSGKGSTAYPSLQSDGALTRRLASRKGQTPTANGTVGNAAFDGNCAVVCRYTADGYRGSYSIVGLRLMPGFHIVFNIALWKCISMCCRARRGPYLSWAAATLWFADE